MKGSAITGPVGKEAAELWPVSILIPILVRVLTNNSSVSLPTPVSLCKKRKKKKKKSVEGRWTIPTWLLTVAYL